MKFPRAFTVDELRQGTMMIVHPITGSVLSQLAFCPRSLRFHRRVCCGGWDVEPRTIGIEPPIYTDETGVKIGDDMPEHWCFDPYNGLKFSSR